MAKGWAAGLAALTATAAAAEPVDGRWRTEPNDEGSYLVVEIGPCPDAAGLRCGDVVAARRADGTEGDRHVGRRMIDAMKPDGPGRWDDGAIWAPDDDRTYDASMALEGDTLSVEGCFLVCCRGQDWVRDR